MINLATLVTYLNVAFRDVGLDLEVFGCDLAAEFDMPSSIVTDRHPQSASPIDVS